MASDRGKRKTLEKTRPTIHQLKVSLPEIDRGAMGGAAFMSRMLPVQKVRANFFTGGRVPVEDVWRHGSIEKIVPLEKLKDEAFAFCEVIASNRQAGAQPDRTFEPR